MARGDKLYLQQRPRSVEARLRDLEVAKRGDKAHRGGGGTTTGTQPPPAPLPTIDIADITATVISAYTPSGLYAPFIRVVVSGSYSSIRSFQGYTVRVFPAAGSAFEWVGPTVPDTTGTIDITSLPLPPTVPEAWRVQVRLRTGLYGPSFWSDYQSLTWGGDLTAPAWTSGAWPVDWLVDNTYDPNTNGIRLQAKWNAITGTPDFDRYQLRLGYVQADLSVVWDAPITLRAETTKYTWTGLLPSTDVQIQVLAQDTSGNQSAWQATSPATTTTGARPAQNRVANGDFEQGEAYDATKPKYWTITNTRGTGVSTDGTATRVSTKPLSGKWHLYLHNVDSASGTHSEIKAQSSPMAVIGGQQYTFSLAAMSLQSGVGVGNLSFQDYYYDSTGTLITGLPTNSLGLSNLPTQYTRYTVNRIVPSNAVTARIEISLQGGRGLTGNLWDVYIDDVTGTLSAGSKDLADKAVQTVNLGDKVVGSGQLADGAVGNLQLGSAAVQTANIGSKQVTTATIADSAVDSLQLAANAVTSAKIGALQVQAGHLENNLNYASLFGLGVTPAVKLDVGGWARFQTSNSSPATGGDALEVFYYTTGGYGGLLAYNRSSSSYLPLKIEGSAFTLRLSGQDVGQWTAGNLTLLNNTTVGGSYVMQFWTLPSTGSAVPQGNLTAEFAVSTRASWTGRLRLSASSFNGTVEGLRVESNGSAPLLGFFGVAAVVRQTGGAATAGTTYTATEQGMINRMYTALRNLGLMN